MSGDFVDGGIKSFLDNGIDLKLESSEEEDYYINQMCEYFNNESNYKAYIAGNKSFEIEKNRNTPIMEIIIRDSILYVVPYADDIFEAFTLVLGFIAKKHLDILNEFRGSDIHKIESPSEVNESNVATDEDSDPDDDDYEWI